MYLNVDVIIINISKLILRSATNVQNVQNAQF
jgi:hypothetical protein